MKKGQKTMVFVYTPKLTNPYVYSLKKINTSLLFGIPLAIVYSMNVNANTEKRNTMKNVKTATQIIDQMIKTEINRKDSTKEALELVHNICNTVNPSDMAEVTVFLNNLN